MWWEKYDESRPWKETPEQLAEELIGSGLSDEQIGKGLQVQKFLSAEKAQQVLAEVRANLEATTRQDDAEYEQSARELYASVKRDQAANLSQKLRAQGHLDALLDLPERFAAMHAGGAVDAGVIEAVAFYRSLLGHRRANVAQKLRAQSGLDRLRRGLSKKTPLPSPRPPESDRPRPAVAVPNSPADGPTPAVPAASTPTCTAQLPRNSSPIKLPRTPQKLPPRNAPCSCGSGKKSKLCCRLKKPVLLE